MPTANQHLASLYRQRQLTRHEVQSLLDVYDRWQSFLAVEASLDVVGRLQYQMDEKAALIALGSILREAGKQIGACDTRTAYGKTEAMIVRTLVNRWVVDSVAEHLDDEQKSAVLKLMQGNRLAAS